MDVTAALRRDHQLLRKKLEFLEAAMRVAPEAQFALREMCWSLARMLDQHIRHENEVLQPYRNRIQALTQARMAQDHADQQIVLRDVNALLRGGIKTPTSQVVPPLAQLIEELREHMDEEERQVFPLVDRLEAEHAPLLPPTTAPIAEEMTVNQVLRDCPKTKEVFDCLCINIPYEGCDCLDEVAWRHGMESRELLEKLEEVLGAEKRPANPSDATSAMCGCQT